MKQQIRKIPLIGPLAHRLYRRMRRPAQPFPGSAEYWQQRYSEGGTSGAGSYGQFAEFKAEVLNDFVRAHDIQSVIEFGSGDGNQLRLAEYPRYLGIDVSAQAVRMCRVQFAEDTTKQFKTLEEYDGQKANLALSLDVIYHLVEDAVFEDYMRTMFDAAERYVIVYSSNTDENPDHEASHVRHRCFTDWVERNAASFELMQHVPNKFSYEGDETKGSFADFWIFKRSDAANN